MTHVSFRSVKCVLTIEVMTVPGLNAPFPVGPRRVNYLRRTIETYESLPYDTTLGESPQIANHVRAMGMIISRHGLQNHFGIHSAHKHHELPKGTVICGSKGEPPVYRVAEPTRIADLHERHIHGHIFVVTDGYLHAYELQDGDAPKVSDDVLKPFIDEFTQYVKQNSLQLLLGLEVLGNRDVDQPVTLELFQGKRSIMIDELRAPRYKRGRTTGWVVKVDDRGGIQMYGNQAHSLNPDGSKKDCYTDGHNPGIFTQGYLHTE